MQLRCARDRNDPRLLCQQPRERDLSRCRLLLFRESTEHIDQRLIRFAILRVEAGDGAAEIRAIELGICVDLERGVLHGGADPRGEQSKRMPSYAMGW